MYGRHIGDARPARSTIQAAGLPRGALVEIDAVVRVSS
jgi:enamine deaminase RidA (YjgF/YER057c/UK114 family)